MNIKLRIEYSYKDKQ